ncbi:MAG TPA: hypothetical protein VF637_03585 [Sphingomicrobium sp.]|jgi:hypothetical protein
MNARRIFIAVALLASLVVATFQPAIAAPGIKHTFFMRGSVVNVDGGVVVCVGKIDGAQNGQILNVYRNVYRRGRRNDASFTRTSIGTVRVGTAVNDHFSNVSVVTGDVKVNDIVELERRVG